MPLKKNQDIIIPKISEMQPQPESLKIHKETLGLEENKASSNRIDPELSSISVDANKSIAVKIVETFIIKELEENPSSLLLDPSPKKSIPSYSELILPETPLNRRSYENPLGENAFIDKNNEEEIESLDRSIEFHFKDILAKDLTQESVFEAFLPDTNSNESTAKNEESLVIPFQNHPHYTAGKKFNLEGETIEWDSCSEDENSSSQHKHSKRQKVPKAFSNSEKNISQPESSRVSSVIDRKQRKEANIGKRKTRFPWRPEELAALEEGMALHGTKWAMILADHGPTGRLDHRLAERSQIQLKDKARTERQARERAGLPIGIFSIACTHN